MKIRLAETNDLDRLLTIFDIAKSYMYDNGNKTQWDAHYPGQALLESDIAKDQLFAIYDETTEIIHGVFVLALGLDPTYAYIEDGDWLNEQPYGTIHRIASDGTFKGLGSICFDYCKEVIPNLRCDTHHDNLPMQQVLLRYGFVECGVIYVEDGSKRLAYQYCS